VLEGHRRFHGRRPDPSTRLADLLIAATAVANDLDLYTRNAADLIGLDGIVRIIEV
jgi:predicted nucleic acid-binding protein